MNAKQHLKSYLSADKATALEMDYEWQINIDRLPAEQQKQLSEDLIQERLDYAQSITETVNDIAEKLGFPKFVPKPH
jgi:hypothetical protein